MANLNLFKRLTILPLIVILSACSTTVPQANPETSHDSTVTTKEDTHDSHNEHAVIDLTAIPLGDGKTTTSVPTEKGFLYVCKIVTGGGGAFYSPWVGENSWDSTKKVKVSGENFFPNAFNSFTETNDSLTVTTNGLPEQSPAGSFPVASTDEAYNYDRNPNTITAQDVTINLPSNPVEAAQPSCTNMGAIGYALNGVAIFNAIDGENRDAVAHEVQDICDGHPELNGTYHYHNGSACLIENAPKNAATLIGYALDGFGIYVEKDANGNLKTNEDLDICHGSTSEVLWKGVKQNIYHYSVTVEFPYTVGCFKGTPVVIPSTNEGPSQMSGTPQGQQPPLNPNQNPNQLPPPPPPGK